MPEIEPFVFERPARRPAAYGMIAVALLGLLVLSFGFSAHPLIVFFFVIVTAPAIWEVIQNSKHRLSIDENTISWSRGSIQESIPLIDVAEARTRTAFDLTQRATLVLKDGRKVRLPQPCLPPGRMLDEVLERHGIKATRSLFGA